MRNLKYTTRWMTALLLLAFVTPVALGRSLPRGLSHEKRPLEVVSVGSESAAHRFLVISGVHGNERLPVEFTRWLKARVASGQGPLAAIAGGNVAFDFVPVVNPDGYAANTRYNALGVNLNRNFGALWGVSREPAGARAFSEPESRFVRDLILSNKYTAAADVHGYVNWVVGPTPPSQMTSAGDNVDPTRAGRYLKWITAIRDGMEHLSIGYVFKTAGGLGDGGAFEDWAFWEGGVLAVSLEVRTADRFGGTQGDDSFTRYEAFLASTFEAATRASAPVLVANAARSRH